LLDEIHEKSGLGTRWGQVVSAACTRYFDCIIASERRARATLALKRIPHAKFVAPMRGFLLSDRKPSVDFTALPLYRQTQVLFELAIDQALVLPRTLQLPPRYVELAAQLLPSTQSHVGFAPGAGGRDKCWPLAHFIAAARAQTFRDRTPVFFLGPDDQAWRPQISAAVPSALFPEYGPDGRAIDGPLLTIALAARMRANVANDSGAGHLLAAAGRPLISLFGHTDAEKFKPPYGVRRVIQASDYGDSRVAAIPVAAVIDALDEACDG